MKDKDSKAERQRLNKLEKKWVKPCGFGWWRIEIVLSSERHPDSPGVAGETHADWKYSHATITFYLPVTVNMDDEELEHTFVHELCHLPMSGMVFPDNDQAQAIFEKTVDDYAKHIIWAYEAGKK